MSGNNVYEEVVGEITDWIERISDDVAPAVMGGKAPPFMKQLTGQRLAEWWGGLALEEKVSRWGQMSPEDQAEVRKVQGY